jgi:TFIIF-interacting CTD phosphatase-like protein
MDQYHERPLLVLDLDETLIHSSLVELLDLTHSTVINDSYYNITYFVYKRPYVDELLNYCLDHFDIGIWTAASDAYAKIVVDMLFKDRKPVFVFSQKRCTPVVKNISIIIDGRIIDHREIVLIKDLSKVWRRRFDGKRYSRDSTLFVDDKRFTFERNYGNAIQVTPWYGNPKDIELYILMHYLKHIYEFKGTWRTMDKRNWKILCIQ